MNILIISHHSIITSLPIYNMGPLSRLQLFLFGVCMASAHVLRSGKPCGHKHGPIIISEPKIESLPMTLPGPALGPYGPQILSQGTNLFYKPHFMLPYNTGEPVPMMAEIKKDCKKPEFVVPETPVIEMEMQPLALPQAPVLPQFTMPEMPVVSVPEPEPLPIVQDLPSPPELPPFVMPELPTMVLPEAPAPMPIEIFEEPVPEVPLAPVPEAPVLPPFVMPEIPTVVYEEPIAPLALPEIPSDVEIEAIPPIPMVAEPIVPLEPVPEALVLPPFEMPELPVVLAEEPKPCAQELPAAPYMGEPVVIPVEPLETLPAVPLLPPLGLPPAPLPILPEPDQELKPVEIPAAPQLSTFVMPTIPESIVMEEPCADEVVEVKPKPVIVPQPITYYPYNLPEVPCDHDIILNRGLPNMIVDRKSIAKEIELYGKATRFPVPSPYFVPRIY